MTIMFYLRLGIRNMLRNKRRALIAGTAIGLGLAALIFSDSLMLGMEENLVESATGTFMGDGQIHLRGYRELPEVEKTIADKDALENRLRHDPRITAFSERVMSFAMIRSPSNMASVQLVGIEPTSEARISQIDEAIVEGRYLSPDDSHGILIGSKLSEILDSKIGGRVVITVAEAHSGELSQEMFRVAGIFHFNVAEMDRGMVFVRLDRAQSMLALDSSIHEIALKIAKDGTLATETSPVWAEYSDQKNEAASWAELVPQIKMAVDLSNFSLLILGLILFAIVALGIINSLFMSLHERMFEFGVMRAVGTRPSRMAILILVEAGALGVIAVILGVALGTLAVAVTGSVGIDYTGIEAMGVTFRNRLFPLFQLRQFILYPVAVFLVTLLIGLYPAVHAARMQPAKAMRRSF